MSQNTEQTVKYLMKLHDDASDARHLHGLHLYNRAALEARLDVQCALRAALAAQAGNSEPAPLRQRLMDDEIDALWDEPLTLPQKVQRRYIARAVEAKITGATHD